MNSKKLFILGASGFLGRNILQALDAREGGKIEGIAVSRHPSHFSQRVQGLSKWVGAPDWRDELEHAVAEGHCTAVIHCVAMTDHTYCEANPSETFRVNVDGLANSAEVCRDLAVPLVFVCTDGLFGDQSSGKAPRYWSTEAAPHPINTYARSKLAAEVALAGLGWGQSIRMSFVGPGFGTGRGLVSFLAKQLRTPSRKVPGFIDNWFSPAPAQAAADRLVDFAFGSAKGHGIHHWGCYPALTKYDYLEKVAQAAGFHPLMIAVRRADLPGKELIPLDQSLDCEAPWSREELIQLGVQALRLELGGIL